MHTDWLHFQQDAAPIRLRSFPTPIKMQERFLRSCTSAESPLLHPHSIDLSGHAVGLTMYLAFRWCRKAWRDSREILKSTWLLIAFESFALPYQVSACHGAAQLQLFSFYLRKHRHQVPIVSRSLVSGPLRAASTTGSVTLAAPLPYSFQSTFRLYLDMMHPPFPVRITYAQNVFLLPDPRICLLSLPLFSSLCCRRHLLFLLHSRTPTWLAPISIFLNTAPNPQLYRISTKMADTSLGSEKDGTRLASSSSLLQGPASLRPGDWDIRREQTSSHRCHRPRKGHHQGTSQGDGGKDGARSASSGPQAR
jgi:hypothetical protein